MPKDYESKLSSKELEDLVSFLITTAADPHPTKPALKKEANDGN
jgi:hypothetical protein